MGSGPSFTKTLPVSIRTFSLWFARKTDFAYVSLINKMLRGAEAVMDPLKMAYGVKKPLEFKIDKISDLYNHQLRYYPIGKAGDVDEWGAV